MFLECLLDEFFTVENTHSHVLVCLEDNKLWVLDKFAEGLLLYWSNVGERSLLKFGVFLFQSCFEVVQSLFDGIGSVVWLPVFVGNIELLDIVSFKGDITDGVFAADVFFEARDGCFDVVGWLWFLEAEI